MKNLEASALLPFVPDFESSRRSIFLGAGKFTSLTWRASAGTSERADERCLTSDKVV